ncbi:MAG: FMN-binding protein [Clostridium fessum]
MEVTKTGASADNQIEAISGATITSKASRPTRQMQLSISWLTAPMVQ